MAPQAESITYTLNQLKETGNTPLRVHYPDISVTKAASSVTKSSVAKPPTLSVSSDLVKLDASKKYIAICLDLDPPFPSMPIMGPLAHCIQADLVPAASTREQGWLDLQTQAKSVLEYYPPSPPPMSGPHRYIFLLWEQPAELNTAEIMSRLSLTETPSATVRFRWNEEDFEKKLGLKNVLAGTYFLC